MIKNNYINHIAFVLDKSGSMSHLSDEVIKVFDSQVKYLAQRSQELDQETRVSVYLFNGQTECVVYDKDVLRLPSLKDLYRAGGSTGLLEATLKSIDDLKKTPELYGDHSFLIYVLTDGQNTDNNHLASKVVSTIGSLPEHWTVAVLVPNALSVREAKSFGFPSQNIQVWATDGNGMREVGEVIKKTTESYMQARSTGVRGTKTLFNLDASKLSKTTVQTALQELKTSEYLLLNVHNTAVIKDYVESWTKQDYRAGSAYYQLTKPEKIQAHKQICVQNKLNGKIYTGAQARNLLGLPNQEIKVGPAHSSDFEIFVQSSSVNRKLVAGTKLIVLK